ncbi:MAG: DUF202 domain-containing protein [Isosphaeraceae bacterium]|nr:DUF202 domain-containing protein [Isosphaeraceae bacterium]
MEHNDQPPSRPAGSGHVTDHLANERTFLAWIRTSLGLIGLGFVLARMGLFLRQLAATAGFERARKFHPGQEFLVSGLVFLLLGTALCAWSGWLYRRTREAIDAGRFEPAWGAVLALTVVMVLGGLMIVGLVLWRTFSPDGA